MKLHKCKICGYLYSDNEAPHECPYCHSPQSVFEELEKDALDFEFFKSCWDLQVKWMNATKYQYEIQLNPDEEVLKRLAEGMKKSLLDENKGQSYCPCRVLTGNKSADRKIICPCYFYMGEIELQGKCHCSLYFKK